MSPAYGCPNHMYSRASRATRQEIQPTKHVVSRYMHAYECSSVVLTATVLANRMNMFLAWGERRRQVWNDAGSRPTSARCPNIARSRGHHEVLPSRRPDQQKCLAGVQLQGRRPSQQPNKVDRSPFAAAAPCRIPNIASVHSNTDRIRDARVVEGRAHKHRSITA